MEQVYKLITLLNTNERKYVLKAVITNGVTIPGFKDINKVPLPLIKNSLRNKTKKGQFYYTIFLKAISSINASEKQDILDENLPITPQKIAMKLMSNNSKNNDDSINSMLDELEHIRLFKRNHLDDNYNVNKIFEEVGVTDQGYIEIIKEDSYKEIIKDNEQLKLKNNNLQAKLLDLKIKNDDITKKIRVSQKELKNLENQLQVHLLEIENNLGIIDSQKNELKNKSEIIIKLEEQIIEQSDKISLLLEHINQLEEKNNLLNTLSMNKNKVLCFSKKLPEAKIIGIDIDLMSDWDTSIINQIDWSKYSKVWIITQDVPYYVARLIETECKIDLEKYYSYNLIEN